MPNIRFRDRLPSDENEAWVNASRHANQSATDAEARYLLTKTAGGVWRIAIRGYNGGEELNAGVDTGHKVHAQVGNQYYDALDGFFAAVHPVAGDERDRYAELMREPLRDDLLVDVLEQEKLGAWDVLTVGMYNEYFPLDRFGYISSAVGTLAARAWNGRKEEFYYTEPVPAKIIQNGPQFAIIPEVRGDVTPISVSSLADRTNEYPILAEKIEE